MSEYCPRCGTEMRYHSLGGTDILPNGKSITRFWGCEKCRYNPDVRGWAFVISDNEYYIFLGKKWQEFREKIREEKVIFT